VDGIPFHPYYTVKDLVGVGIFFILFAISVFYAPEMGGFFLEPPNFEPADPLKTPEHIAPVWYFTPFYSILRAIPSKFGGVVAMGASIVVLFLLPWLDRCPVRSIRYRSGLYAVLLTLFVLSFIGLGILGTKPVSPGATILVRIFSLVYFGFFLLMPWWSGREKTYPEPTRLTAAVMPLSERPGRHWDVVRRVVGVIESSPAYHQACGWLCDSLGKLERQVGGLFGKNKS
jgi:ubiquinol-cytochrome c reductase cytochrome b subunit